MIPPVERSRPVPIARRTIIMIVLPLALPMLAVVAVRLPVREVLLHLLKALL